MPHRGLSGQPEAQLLIVAGDATVSRQTVDSYPDTAYVSAYAKEARVSEARKVSLFRNGRNQAVRIPVDLELPGEEATIRREGDLLILEPVRKMTLFEFLDQLEPVPDFPDVDDRDLLPLRDIDLE